LASDHCEKSKRWLSIVEKRLGGGDAFATVFETDRID
jgi:hypothetical protein